MLPEVGLYAGYTLTSVLGLIIAKQWLPAATTAWQVGTSIVMPGLMVGLGMGLYVVSFLLWMVILARNDLSVAYPTAIGLTLVFSTLTATVWLGEVMGIGTRKFINNEDLQHQLIRDMLYCYSPHSLLSNGLPGVMSIDRNIEEIARIEKNSGVKQELDRAPDLRDPLILYFAMLGRPFGMRQARA
jgi:hypothetical protein